MARDPRRQLNHLSCAKLTHSQALLRAASRSNCKELVVFTSAESPIAPEASTERRFYPRVAPFRLVGIAFGGGNLGMLLNLSENGLLVSTPLALVQNFVCRVSLFLDGLPEPIEVYVRVVWTCESHRAGIQLLDLCDHDREQLRKWAAFEAERRGTPGPAKPLDAATDTTTSVPASVRQNSAPQKAGPRPLSFRLPLVACAAAAVLILFTALVLRGTPFHGLLSHSFKPETSATMAMQPGGTVANEPPNTQALATPFATPKEHSSLTTPAVPTPSATIATPIPSQENPAQLQRSSPPVAGTNKPAPPGIAPATRSSSFSAKSAIAAHQMPAIKRPVVRNGSVLQAQKHFGDQFIGHLDLANSSDGNTSAGKTLPIVAGSVPTPSSAVEEQPGVPAASTARLDSHTSAINGSITADSAALPHENNADGAAASPAASASAVPADPADPSPADVPNSSDRSLQVTLPASARALYINLPGEQVVQSPAMTLHIQRAVLAPAAASSAPRKETVMVGDLLSHVDPQAPRLTSETGTRVGVRAFLTSDGRVARLMPVNGSVALVSSAARAIREWRFEPTLLAGKPVPMAIYVLVEFHAEQAEHP